MDGYPSLLEKRVGKLVHHPSEALLGGVNISMVLVNLHYVCITPLEPEELPLLVLCFLDLSY